MCTADILVYLSQKGTPVFKKNVMVPQFAACRYKF